MYSFAQREDTVVYDEPLYGYYLSHTNAKEYHPGADEVIASLENDGDQVVRMMMGPQPKPVVFYKNMTHHLLDLDRSFMKDVYNIILTRDPVEMLPSFAKEIQNPSMKDVGYEDHIDLLNAFTKMDITPIVIDSKQLLMNPPKIIRQLCSRVAIPFDESMLSWEPGPRPEDGVWGKYWYGSLHQSNGFTKYQPKTTPFPDHLKPLLELCLPYYHQLMKLSLK